jgi:hypothetical protein
VEKYIHEREEVRMMRKHKKLFILVLVTALIPIAAWANMGIPIVNPVDHRMVFDSDSGIRMVEEIVAFSFDSNKDLYGDKKLYSSRVAVSYVLRNEDDVDKIVDMVFVTPYMGEDGFLEVRSAGEMIETGEAEHFEEMPLNWEASRQMPIVEPLSGKILKNSPSVITGAVSRAGIVVWGTRFSVNLPAGENVNLEVAYDSESGIYRYQNVINDVFSQIYYLTPAKFYEGEAKVTLKVDFPEGIDIAFTSNIPMVPVGENEFIAELDGLPEEEWLFSFTDKEGLVLGTNDRTLNNGIVLGVFAVFMVLSVWLWKKKKRKVMAICGGVIAACSLTLFRPSYGMVFLLYIAAPIIGIAVLVFLFVWVMKRVLANRRQL